MARTLDRRGIGDFAAAFDEIRDSHGSIGPDVVAEQVSDTVLGTGIPAT